MAQRNINIADEQKRQLNFILNHLAKAIRKDCIASWESNIEVHPMEPTIETFTIKINRTLLDHEDPPQEQRNTTQGQNTRITHTEDVNHGEAPLAPLDMQINRQEIGEANATRDIPTNTISNNTISNTDITNVSDIRIADLPIELDRPSRVEIERDSTGRIISITDQHGIWQVGSIITDEMQLQGISVPPQAMLYREAAYMRSRITGFNDDQNNQSIRRPGNRQIADGRTRVRNAQATYDRDGARHRVREGTYLGQYTQTEVESADLRATERAARQINEQS